jgi:thiamine-phosphate pyrophosphorylase
MGGGISAGRAADFVKRYCITDSVEVARRAVESGASMIQVRAKRACARAVADLVREVLAVAGCPVLVNARTDVALACGAQGVHLPADSIAPPAIRRIAPAGFLIGVSCHSIAELRAAEAEGADFAVFGPIFPSVTKSVDPVGLEVLREAAAAVQLSVYALGGVTRENEALCVAAGAAGVAGISFFAQQ